MGSRECPEGRRASMYDLYALVRGDTPPSLPGVSVDSLAHQTGSNGLWQYTPAVETLNIDDWKPGLWTGLLNTKIPASKFKTRTSAERYGAFDGSTRELPASTW